MLAPLPQDSQKDLQGRDPSLSHTEKEKEEKEERCWNRTDALILPWEGTWREDISRLVETWPFHPCLQTGKNSRVMVNQEGGWPAAWNLLNKGFVATVFYVAQVAYNPFRNVNMVQESTTLIAYSDKISPAAGWNMCKQTRRPTTWIMNTAVIEYPTQHVRVRARSDGNAS